MKKLVTLLFLISITLTSKAQEDFIFTSTRDGNYEVYLQNKKGEITRITDAPDNDFGLNWSPNGKSILFYSDRSGNEEIYSVKANGKKITNLSNHNANERAAAFSPNGKNIVFISNRDGNKEDLYLMKKDGSNVQRLTSRKSYCESPVWSKDGKFIFYTREIYDSIKGNFYGEIFSFELSTKREKQLTDRKVFSSGSDISPDGNWVTFYSKTVDGFYDIFIMKTDGTGCKNLTNDKQEDYSPSWSSDGKYIYFTSGSALNYDVWKINVETGVKENVTNAENRDESPRCKP